MGYTWAVSEICRIVLDGVGGETAQRIVQNLYQRKCLHMYEPDRFRKLEPALQDAWLHEHRAFVERFISEEMERRLPSPWRERSYFVRQGDKAGLLACLAHEHEPLVKGELVSARWTADGIAIAAEVTVEGRLELPRQLYCELRRRDGEGASAFPLVRAAAAPSYGEAAVYEGVLPKSSIRALVAGAYDLYVVSMSARARVSCRVRWRDGLSAPAGASGFQIRGTKQGNVSVKKSDERAGAPLAFGVVRRAMDRVARMWRLLR